MITTQDIATNLASMKQLSNWVYSVRIGSISHIVKLATHDIRELEVAHRNAMVNSAFGIPSCSSHIIPLDMGLQKEILSTFQPRYKITMSHALCMVQINDKTIRSNIYSPEEKDTMYQYVVDQLYPRYVMSGYTDIQKKHILLSKEDNGLYTVDTELGLYTYDQNRARPFLRNIEMDIPHSVQNDFDFITADIKRLFPKNPIRKDIFLQICEENKYITEDRFPAELYETGGPVQDIMHERAKALIPYAQKKLR